MPLKWKLFGLANYFILLVYIFLLLGAMRFTIEVDTEGQGMLGFMFFMISLFIVVLNAVFNLYIFHKHLPDNKISKRGKIAYKISATLYAVSLLTISITLIRDTIHELKIDADSGAGYFMLIFFCVNSLIGLFVLINQFRIIKFIEKNTAENAEE
jgi:small-conductance mechanosensitive channel